MLGILINKGQIGIRSRHRIHGETTVLRLRSGLAVVIINLLTIGAILLTIIILAGVLQLLLLLCNNILFNLFYEFSGNNNSGFRPAFG